MTTKTITFPRAFPRPKSETGLWSWIGTIDHKRIGTLYGITSFAWFLIGGIEALIIRTQLAQAEASLVSPDFFNQLFTMHAITMIFLVVMPLSAAFFNWLIPLQIGARDVAFPRLNAFSYWMFLFGSIVLNISWLVGQAPNGGWFGYAPNSGQMFNTSMGMTYYAIGLNLLGIASIAAGLNFIVTIINMRAPGMSMFRMPVFTWMGLVTQVLVVLAMPIIAVALIQLQTDRLYGTNFFDPTAGGDPIIWQHMFWLFGHPEVYILILPAMGIVSEIIPTFSKKPLFGYPFMVFAGIAIGFMGWFVWSHHMFTVGLGPAANTAFAVSTMLIAIPTGIKIFNWLGTMYGGSIRLNTAMLFAISFIAMFTIGGLSGVMHAAVPSDAQQQDTYFVVAHFHYVLYGGAIMAIFGGIFYWWPKFTGWMLDEKLGKVTWFIMLIGFNFTFGPMHWLGMDGMPRRIYTYAENMGWQGSNLAATIGGFLIAISVFVFLVTVLVSRARRVPAGDDPWDGRTLEWSISSPPPAYNFAEIPHVHSIDDFWYQKHPELLETHGDEHVAAPSGAQFDENEEELFTAPSGGAGDEGHGGGHGIHLPDMSYYPLILAAGVAIAGFGLMHDYWIIALGGVLTIWGFFGWGFEPVNDPTPEGESHH